LEMHFFIWAPNFSIVIEVVLVEFRRYVLN